jgi:hypothetical protein
LAPPAAAQPAGDDAARKEASDAFRKAKVDYEAGRFEPALSGFKTSYERYPSPNSRLMVARSFESLGRLIEAYDEARAVVPEAEEAANTDPKYDATRDSAKELVKTVALKLTLVNVSIRGDATGGTLEVGDRTIDEARWGEPIAVMPGAVQVRLMHDGRLVERTRDGAAGQTLHVELAFDAPVADPIDDAPAPSDDDMPLLIPAIVAGGVGVTGLVLFGVFGGLNNATFSDLEAQCPGGACPQTVADDIDTGQSYQTVANVALVFGLVGIAAAGTLVVFDLLDDGDGANSDSADSDSAASAASMKPRLAVGVGSIAIEGRF